MRRHYERGGREGERGGYKKGGPEGERGRGGGVEGQNRAQNE